MTRERVNEVDERLNEDSERLNEEVEEDESSLAASAVELGAFCMTPAGERSTREYNQTSETSATCQPVLINNFFLAFSSLTPQIGGHWWVTSK